MDGLTVDTDKISASAEEIRSANLKMYNEFTEVKAHLKRLGNEWDGRASDHAMESFYDIESKFAEQRKSILDSYADFLKRNVQQGYESAENANKSAAERYAASFLQE